MTVELYGSHHDQYAEMYHYGIKGMKWGVRKNRHTKQDVKAARVRQKARVKQLDDLEDKVYTTKPGSKQNKAAREAYRKKAYEFDTSDDRAVANKLTRGEAAVVGITLALTTTPIGAMAGFAGMRAHQSLVERDINKKRSKGYSKFKDGL